MPGKTLEPDQKAWLGRFLGTKVPWTVTVLSEGVETDAESLYQELLEYDRALAAGDEFEGTQPLRMEEARQLLAAVGIPSLEEQAAKHEAARAKKDEELKKVRDLLELQKEAIRQATDVEYKVKRKVLPGSKTIKAKKGANVEKEYSQEHYKDRTTSGPTPEQQKALKLVIAQLELLTERLRKNEDIAFTPNELMEELWTPLVREQIISEDQCPQEFSRVLQLWQGASQLYQERCKAKAKEAEQPFTTARGVLDDLDQVLGIGAGVADVVLTALGTGAEAKNILRLVKTCAKAGVQIASNALAKDLSKVSTNIGDVLGAAVPAPFGSVSKGAFLACCNGGLIAQKLAQRDKDAAFDLLADAVSNSFASVSAGANVPALAIVGTSVKTALKTGYSSSKVVALMQQDPVNTKAVLDELSKVTRDVTKHVATTTIAETLHKDLQEEKKAKLKAEGKSEEQIKEELSLLKASQGDQRSKLGTDVDREQAAWTQFTAALKKQGVLSGPIDEAKVQEAALKAGAGAMNQELDEAQAIFQKRIGAAFNVGVGADSEDEAQIADLYSIDALIAQIQADRAQLELVSALIDAVGGVVSMIVPQLGGPLKAKQFAMNVVAAVRRSQELIKMKNLVSDAKKATSPQAYALLAEVDELNRQLSNDVIDAALNLGQAISITATAALEMSGIAAAGVAASQAVTSGLQTTQQAKDFIMKKIKDTKVKRAWQKFRRALDNPQDRILVIRAFRKNPTLAKYAMAYGAMEMGDPIAKEALRSCGLNDMVLAQENTNADKVVQYLEAKFADDVQVVGVISRFVPDAGEPLTLASWTKNKKAAATADKAMKWQSEPTSNIDAAFSAVEKAQAAVQGQDIGEAADVAPWRAIIEAHQVLAKALRAYRPKTTEGPPFDQFARYLDELAFAAEREAGRLKGEIAESEETRKLARGMYTKTLGSADEAVAALTQAERALGAPSGRSPDELLTFCSGPPAKSLLAALKKAATQTGALAEPVSLLEQTLKLTQRKADKGKKLATSGDNAAAGKLIDEAIQTLAGELTAASQRAAELKQQATEALAALGA